MVAQQPLWQVAARWCTTDPGSSGKGYYTARANGSDAYDSVLYCQGHNGGAQQAVRNAGRSAVNTFLGFVPPPPPPVPTAPVWQIAAHWCTIDRGSSGKGYYVARANGSDAYDSVLYCQGHNGDVQQAVRNAGRSTVNAFLGFVPPPVSTAPLWQIAAHWCTTDPGSSGKGYHLALANGSDAYDSVLYCQGHNRSARSAITHAGRSTVNAFLGYVPRPGPPVSTQPTQLTWREGAKWCTTDPGSSGSNYKSSRREGKDQFDSVLDCQSHNRDFQNVIRNIGRTAVNDFMGNVSASAPQLAVPQPAQFYVTGRFQCKPSGSCDISNNSRVSCADAHVAFDQAVAQRNNNACSQCEVGNIISGRSVSGFSWIHDGPCRGQ